jgi:hypothetical protein
MHSSAGAQPAIAASSIAQCGFVRHLLGTQVVRRLVVHLAHARDECLEDRLRLHAVVAALEIDVVGLEAVLPADRQPERFVLGEAFDRHLGVFG